MELGLTAYDVAFQDIAILYTLEFEGQLQEQALQEGLQQ